MRFIIVQTVLLSGLAVAFLTNAGPLTFAPSAWTGLAGKVLVVLGVGLALAAGVSLGSATKLSPTPMTPPVKPIRKASPRKILSSCPLEAPLDRSKPISRRRRLKETLATVEARYQLMKKRGSEVTIEPNRMLVATYC